ncbi:hypothetical protein DSO57_1039090 [Entomophthora muscae]|uniref:Uncharacterized protein n=1 Tax=Entomophthora muscae TaxID=34485 RepID=A0ACC2RPF9_9FUNG|nr:hypothetical protein DSO57_1039090 [Entomophthora muscae]
MSNKLGTPICNDVFGSSKTGHNFLANEVSDGGGGVVSDCPHYWPVGEKSMSVMIYFFPSLSLGRGPTMSRAHFSKGSMALIGRMDLGGNSGKINCRDVKERIQKFSLLSSHFYIPTVDFATVALGGAGFDEIQYLLVHTQPPNLTFNDFKEVTFSDMAQGAVVVQYGVISLCGGNIGCLFSCLCAAADISNISGE